MMSSYGKLAGVLAVNLAIMFALSYALVASADHFVPNLNRFYMAVLMSLPVAVLMVLAMPSIFTEKRFNNAIFIGAGALFAIVFLLLRTQAFVGNEGLLRSMIPHHSGAIVMCRDAKLTDPEVRRLCTTIIETQQREITEMKGLLDQRNDTVAGPEASSISASSPM